MRSGAFFTDFDLLCRNPVDRILSAYEFSVEVAIRQFINKPVKAVRASPCNRSQPGKAPETCLAEMHLGDCAHSAPS